MATSFMVSDVEKAKLEISWAVKDDVEASIEEEEDEVWECRKRVSRERKARNRRMKKERRRSRASFMAC